jgi:hypothetical protein
MNGFEHRLIPRVILLCAMVQLSGCATTPMPHFYQLGIAADSQGVAANDAEDGPLIGIGPIRLPGYLDRSQIVTRANATELNLSDSHRWAEPLQENFTRTLAEQLSQMLGTSTISIEPSRNRANLDLRIMVDVIRFDADRNGDVFLIAYWSVENLDDSMRFDQRKSTIHVQGGRGPDYPGIVTGMSEAVYQLAREIAAELPR